MSSKSSKSSKSIHANSLLNLAKGRQKRRDFFKNKQSKSNVLIQPKINVKKVIDNAYTRGCRHGKINQKRGSNRNITILKQQIESLELQISQYKLEISLLRNDIQNFDTKPFIFDKCNDILLEEKIFFEQRYKAKYV